MRDLLPPEVFNSIRGHLRQASEEAPEGWTSNKAEEDSLTGDLGRLLRTIGSIPVFVDGKPGWQWGNADLMSQLENMEAIAPGGSAVFVYGPNGYFGAKGTEYLHPPTVGEFAVTKLRPLSEVLDDFLECKNGLRGMYLDAVRELLLVPSISGELKAHEVEVRHRVKILVTQF